MITYAPQLFERLRPVSNLPEWSLPQDDIGIAPCEPSVLVADDDPDIAPLVDASLKPFHICTEAVSGGVEAMMRLRVRKYDLVILDLGMADVHGYGVLRALRRLPLNRDVPVLILTANGTNEAIARSFGHGADEFVKKPFDPREFGLRAFRLIRPFEN